MLFESLFIYVPTEAEIEELTKVEDDGENADMEGDKEMEGDSVAKLYGFDKYDADEQVSGGMLSLLTILIHFSYAFQTLL